MASINTTITIQAASDSLMTIDNAGGTALADDDCRKVYGLPHTYVARPSLKDISGNTLGKEETQTIGRHVITHFSGRNRLMLNQSNSMTSGQLSVFGRGARWDQISPVDMASQRSILSREAENNDFPNTAYTGGYGLSDVSITDVIQQACAQFTVDRRPKTTAFQLHCDTLTHISQDMTAITPLPGVEWGDDVNTGTPEQMSNLAVGLGFRQEKLSLGGVLLDRGHVTALNPRRQVLLNIARTQYLKVRNAAPPQSKKESGIFGTGFQFNPGGGKIPIGSIGRVKEPPQRGRQHAWGGIFAGPTNPRSYPCLTIHNQDYDASIANTYHDPDDGTNWRPPTGDVEADGGYKIYRGMITQISFSMEPGRPDFWRWSMDFSCITNEKRALGALGDPVDNIDVNEDSAG